MWFRIIWTTMFSTLTNSAIWHLHALLHLHILNTAKRQIDMYQLRSVINFSLTLLHRVTRKVFRPLPLQPFNFFLILFVPRTETFNKFTMCLQFNQNTCARVRGFFNNPYIFCESQKCRIYFSLFFSPVLKRIIIHLGDNLYIFKLCIFFLLSYY